MQVQSKEESTNVAVTVSEYEDSTITTTSANKQQLKEKATKRSVSRNQTNLGPSAAGGNNVSLT